MIKIRNITLKKIKFKQITRPGGTVALVGMGSDTVEIPVAKVTINEINIKGVFRYVNE